MELKGISKLDLKRRNRAQILKVIKNCGPISRVDIASSMKITRAAVTIITNEMIEEGVLYEVGEAPVSLSNLQKGRRKILIDINENYKYIFGASVSNKRVTVGLTNLNGSVIDKACCELSADMKAEEIFDFIVNSSKEIMQNNDLTANKILGMGIGIQPDMFSKLKVYLKDGKPDYSNVIQKVSLTLGIPITCSNLVAALALANQNDDIKEREGNYVLLKQGRHLNLAVLIDNEIMNENNYYTSHVENMIVNPGGRKISGYPDGSAKAELTTIAISEKIREIFSKENTPILWQALDGNVNNLNSKAITTACLKGESETLNAVNSYLKCLTTLVNNLSFSFFANSIILHEFDFDEWMFEYFKKFLVTYCSDEVAKKLKLSKCEKNLEFFGGACVALNEQFYKQGGMTI
jgi:predicted NBD/HSP70 family sugar kinase